MDVFKSQPTDNAYIGLDELEKPAWYVVEGSECKKLLFDENNLNSPFTRHSIEYEPFRNGKFQKGYPLLQNQSEIWLACKLGGIAASKAFNIACSITINQPLDIEKFSQAFERALHETEAFKTVFSKTGRYRLIQCDPVHDFAYYDAASDGANEASAKIKVKIRNFANQAFSLEAGGLLRILLIKLEANKYQLVITTHHAVCDRRGLLLYIDHCIAKYHKLVTQSSDGVKKDITKRLAINEATPFNLDQVKKSQDYWREKMTVEHEYTEFPLDFVRGADRQYRCDVYAGHLEDRLSEKLLAYARSISVKPKIILLTAYTLLLARLNQQPKVGFGLSTSLRDNILESQYLGNAVCLIPLFADISSIENTRDLITQVDQTTKDIYQYNQTSYGEIIGYSSRQRSVNKPPLFSSTVSFSDSRAERLSYPIFSDSAVEWISRSSELFDNSVNFQFDAERIYFECYFNSALFKPEIIEERFLEFQLILSAILEEVEVSHLNLLSNKGRQNYLKINNTKTPVPNMLLHQFFEQQVVLSPTQIAVIDIDREISYQALNVKAEVLALSIHSRGLPQGSVIGLCLDRNIDYLVAMLATLKCGMTFLPIDPSLPLSRIRHIVTDSSAQLILCKSSFSELFSEMSVELYDPSSAISKLPAEKTILEGIETNLEQPAYLIYTSGSTGVPKGVRISHRAIANFLSAMQSLFPLSASDNFLALTTFSFDISLLELLLPLSCGAKVTIATREQRLEPDALASLIDSNEITHIQTTPTTWRLLLKTNSQRLSSVVALCGGEALSLDLKNQLFERVKCLWNMYGPTETTIWSSCHQVISVDEDIFIGQPIDNTQFYILGQNDDVLPRGVIGELYIGGNGLFSGYQNAEALTHERFISKNVLGEGTVQLYRTGDLVKLTYENKFQFISRADRQVKVRGHRIELAEIEHVLSQHESIDACLSRLVEVPGNDNKIAVYVKYRNNLSETTTGLRRFMREFLPDYMLPQFIVQIDELPLTQNKKVDYNALPNVYKTEHQQHTRDLPKSDIERQFVDICAEILSIDTSQISLSDNFFEIGGNSLSSLRVIEKVRVLTGKRLSPRLFILESLRNIVNELDHEHLKNTVSYLASNEIKATNKSWFDKLRSRLFRH
ncbi:amino acid adenylation domain-containing protein [Aliikangiella marina]|uniref:Amino acid adenylation domain-containing protein n=1 Tax=Aliikangiella marina TaxID=1712262 RepID=A0A545TBL4_9GAMM|nr:non-ribosomal peptide synthetase [Aliikangiella marina]TQV74610.1 amino acid adenylation domain-containing protein [Aliikangiella marina]